MFLHACEALTTKVCRIATLAPRTETFWQGGLTAIFAADSDTCRSVTGYVMALNSAPISWRSCCQGGVTLSSNEAEYVGASSFAQENAYLRALLSGFDHSLLAPHACRKTMLHVFLWVSILSITVAAVTSMWNFISSTSEYVQIKLYKCWVPLNVADALTKSLPRPAFHKHAPFMHGTRSSYRPFTDPGA